MEILFKECPHPDDKQREHLSSELGLKPRQVKSWFQNRRTQMKAQTKRDENTLLHQENEKLRSENVIMPEAFRNPTCQYCEGPATTIDEMSFDKQQQVHNENGRLKEELEHVSVLAACKDLDRPIPPHVLVTPPVATLSLP
jgi:homeobox-leucine zipper protein